jgi:hypothetical protein
MSEEKSKTFEDVEKELERRISAALASGDPATKRAGEEVLEQLKHLRDQREQLQKDLEDRIQVRERSLQRLARV